MKNLPEVWEVEWVDSTGKNGWLRDGEARGLCPDIATTVGFLIEEDTERVVMSASTVHLPKEDFGHHVRFDSILSIPRCAIRKSKRIRKARG